MTEIQTEPLTTNKDWEAISRNKTKAIQKFLPDYNPQFYPGSDSENIEECFKKLINKYEEEFQKQEYNTMVKEEQEELNSIGKDDENGNYQDIIEDLENTNKELQEEIKTSNDINIKLKDDNVKLIDEIECMKSVIDMSDEEYEGELKDKEAIVNYLTDELDKYKKLFDESKKENQKAKDIKGIVVNEDKTIITINGVELNIGDKFTTDNTEYILKEIYVGKSGKYSLRTDKITIRIGNKYIVGKNKIFKK
jgi:predicted RNase H-like nuclease (RuvC/YqgF family)